MTIYHVFEASFVCIGKLVHLEPSSSFDVGFARFRRRTVVHFLLVLRARCGVGVALIAVFSLTISTEGDDEELLSPSSFFFFFFSGTVAVSTAFATFVAGSEYAGLLLI